MQGQPIAQTGARYDFLDWLRVIAIFVLLFYHAGMLFVGLGLASSMPRKSPSSHGRWTSRIACACHCCSSSLARGCGSH